VLIDKFEIREAELLSTSPLRSPSPSEERGEGNKKEGRVSFLSKIVGASSGRTTYLYSEAINNASH
jgi:hypothetical protein